MKDSIAVDFIGIGAGRCATTWVYTCLLEHPRICGPYMKELNFFITKKNPMPEKSFEHYKLLYNKGIESYLESFKHCPADSVKGEISVAYLIDPGAVELIKKYFPDTKILVFLRDPVERAYSHYWFAKKFKLTEKSETFKEAIKKEVGYEHYIDDGMYYKHLKKYYDVFPKENIGVFLMDDLKKDPVKFIQNVYKFIGVDSNFIPPSVKERTNSARQVRWKFLRSAMHYSLDRFYSFLNFTHFYFIKDIAIRIGLQKMMYRISCKVNVTSFKKPPLDAVTEEKLRKLFWGDIANLEKLIGRDLSSWKRST